MKFFAINQRAWPMSSAAPSLAALACRLAAKRSGFALDFHNRFKHNPVDRLGLGHPRPAFLACAARWVRPEILHRLLEVIDDVPAVEFDVFHQRVAILAIPLQMLGLARR